MSKKKVIDAIREWYIGSSDIELTDSQEAVRARLSFAQAHMGKFKLTKQTVQALMQEFGIKENQAYTDIRHAKSIFGDASKASKEGDRMMAKEYIMYALKLAKKDGSAKDIIAGVKVLSEIQQLDKDDSNMPDWDKLTPSVYPIVLHPLAQKQLETLQQLGLESGALNLNNVLRPEIVEVEIVEDDEDEV